MAKITDRINALPPESLFFSLEFFPPKTPAGFQNLLPRLHRLRALNPLFVCVTFGAGGTTASKSLELASICQTQLDLTTCLHLTCTNLQRGTIDSVLDECKRLGIRNILALRGDEPRDGEYAAVDDQTKASSIVKSNGSQREIEADDVRFTHAADLITYIRTKYGSYFCIGAAAYPEGHPTPSPAHPGGIYQSVDQDLPHLIEKAKAGADFFLTQLFYDAEKYLTFEKLLRSHESGLFDSIPIVPGLMPIQGWQSFSRTCKLARVALPSNLQSTFHTLRGDDEGIKSAGVKVVSDIVRRIKNEGQSISNSNGETHDSSRSKRFPRGFHFYTLNLEKAVAQILERSEILQVIPADPQLNGTKKDKNLNGNISFTVEPPSPTLLGMGDDNLTPGPKKKRRSSSVHNRVIVSSPVVSSGDFDYVVSQDKVGIVGDEEKDDNDTLAMSEGEGSLGREATWDDFPNGRWGDARSPAYGSTNNYTLHPQLAPSAALSLWSRPTSSADITSIFHRFLSGALASNPWSEEGLSPETEIIRDQLLALNEKGWWTVASQPAVNACPSGDEVFGWGPRSGGWVWQKPFVEFFLPKQDWLNLKKRLDKLAANDEITYLAGNEGGDFEASHEGSLNPVTWGAFSGKEIITPTIIEPTSFLAWREEAFAIWREWARIFPPVSPSAKLLEGLSGDCWLVNVIGHDYVNGQKFWDILLE